MSWEFNMEKGESLWNILIKSMILRIKPGFEPWLYHLLAVLRQAIYISSLGFLVSKVEIKPVSWSYCENETY